MSLTVGDTVSATSQQGPAAAIAGDRFPNRPAGQMPDGADALSKPKSLPSEPENPLVRAHPAASTADPLQRLRESSESSRLKSRTKKGAAAQTPEAPSAPASATQSVRSPYDPAPARQRDLDLMA